MRLVTRGDLDGLAAAVVIADSAPSGPWRNVRDYGAVGNGQTDDAPAFQAAVDSLPAGGFDAAFGASRDELPEVTVRLGEWAVLAPKSIPAYTISLYL